MLFTSSRSDSLEDLLSQGKSRNGTDYVHSCLFLANVADPLQEDIFKLRYINVACFSGLEGSKCCLEVLLYLITIVCHLIEILSQSLDLVGLSNCSLVTMFLKSAPVGQSIMVISIELTLNGVIVLFGPSAESFQKPVLFPINHDFFHSTLLLVIFASVLKPCIETSAILHLSHTTHVICHDFLGQILRFGLNCNTTRFDSLDLFSLIYDL